MTSTTRFDTLNVIIKSDRGTWPFDVAATYFGKVRKPCDGGHITAIRRPKMCGHFKPGHNPHWIQMSRATNDKVNFPLAGRFVDSGRDGTTLIEVRGRKLRMWNHEPERLSEAAAKWGGEVQYQPRWGLLWVPCESGRYAFCVALSITDHVACPLLLPMGSPVQLLESAGGFAISVDGSLEEKC